MLQGAELMARLYDSRKRVLVTGGAGFLGSHLIDRLLQQGHEVLCVDNLFTGTKRNMEHLHSNPRFEFFRHDVTFPLYVEADEIYNLACPASPIHYQHDPMQTTKTSVHGAINMLGLAKRVKAHSSGRTSFAMSAFAFANQTHLPIAFKNGRLHIFQIQRVKF